MAKHPKEEPARVMTRAERFMAARIRESCRLAAEYEATLDERQQANPSPSDGGWVWTTSALNGADGFQAGQEDAPRVFLQLDGAHRDMAKKESSEDSAPGSGEEMQFTKWNIQLALQGGVILKLVAVSRVERELQHLLGWRPATGRHRVVLDADELKETPAQQGGVCLIEGTQDALDPSEFFLCGFHDASSIWTFGSLAGDG